MTAAAIALASATHVDAVHVGGWCDHWQAA